MKRKEYRKMKMEWFAKHIDIMIKGHKQRKKEWELFKERARLDMELTQLRIFNEKLGYAMNKEKNKMEEFENE